MACRLLSIRLLRVAVSEPCRLSEFTLTGPHYYRYVKMVFASAHLKEMQVPNVSNSQCGTEKGCWLHKFKTGYYEVLVAREEQAACLSLLHRHVP